MRTITGSCLCGAVSFEVLDEFDNFHLCHCAQCRKITGSAHASNLFIASEKLQILSGEEQINHYSDSDRDFSKSFCRICGSGLPHASKTSNRLVVPAGSLDTEPELPPQDNIFWSERAGWYEIGLAAETFEHFPE